MAPAPRRSNFGAAPTNATRKQVLQWIAERCVLSSPGAVSIVSDVFADYAAWTRSEPGRPNLVTNACIFGL